MTTTPVFATFSLVLSTKSELSQTTRGPAFDRSFGHTDQCVQSKRRNVAMKIESSILAKLYGLPTRPFNLESPLDGTIHYQVP